VSARHAGPARRRAPLAALLGACALAWLGASPTRAAEPVDCLIEPWRRITLSAAIEGVVEDVLVERGDLVEKGQVVARLESRVEQASLEVARIRAQALGPIRSAEARREFARAELERQERLDEREIVSQRDLDEARSALQIAEAEVLAAQEVRSEASAELERTRAILERRTIRSPIDGVVVDVILSSGEYADPPQLLELAQIDPLRVEAFVPLERFGEIEPGMVAEVLPEGPRMVTREATVVVVDPVIDAASATFRVRLELPNPDLAVPAGLSCTVRFSQAVAGGGASGAETTDAGPGSPASAAP
jgi:RND family efflux transporter MFP subunit